MPDQLHFVLKKRAEEAANNNNRQTQTKPKPLFTEVPYSQFHAETIPEEEVEQLKHKLLAASYTTYGSDLKKLFAQIDKDHQGTIDLHELGYAVKRLLPDLSDNQVRGLTIK
jgi:hypothetical protein